MDPLRTDLSIFKKSNFANHPVGVKFSLFKPDGFEPLDQKLAFCEILKEAFKREKPFYFSKEQEDCFGRAILGMVEEDKSLGESGIVGYKWGLFQEPRANGRLYHKNYHLGKGTVNYVVFSPIEKLTFDPDLLLIMANPDQAEIILRAMTYSTGELYESKTSPVLGCCWLFTYPYMSGKVNYMLTNLQTHGMKSRKVFPDGWVLMSIPFNWIPTIAQSLNEMRWDLPEYAAGKEYFMQERQRILNEVMQEFKK
jgi:uncharacterized protein (DUF169 family)